MDERGIFKVKEVIDGDTFTVSPNWKYNDKENDRVRPAGYDTPEKGDDGYEEAGKKLKDLIEGKSVSMTNSQTIDDYGRLLCDVTFDNKNLADYFPEYKV